MSSSDKPYIMHDEKESSEKHGESTTAIESDLTTILKNQPINTWGRGSLHLYAVCLLVYLCSTMNGTSRSNRTIMMACGLIGNRLRRITHGLHQRRPELHFLLQPAQGR